MTKYETPEGETDREQLECVLKLFEIEHGRAIKFENPTKAKAYYRAIDCVEFALAGDWDLDVVFHSEFDAEYVQISQEARAEGWERATLRDVYEREREEKYGPSGPIEKALWPIFDRLESIWWDWNHDQ